MSDNKCMRVIIDSNQAIREDWFLSGPAFKELLRSSERGHIELIIPQIVFDEVTNKYRETLQELQRSLRKTVREMEKLGSAPTFGLPDDTHLDQAAQKYELRLGEIIASHHVRVTPYPVADHAFIARRAMNRRKPFDAQGHNGYRDTLLWTSVLEAAAEDKVALISANWRDFAESKEITDELANDLLEDLDTAGHGRDRVRLYPSVSEFVKSWIEPATQIQRQLQDRLDTDQIFRGELEGMLASVIEDQIDLNVDLGPQAMGEPVEISPQVAQTFHILTIQGVRKLTEDEYFVSIFAEVDVDMSVTERIDTGSWRIDDLIETRGLSKTIDFEFDSIYRNNAFVDTKMTYPS